MEDAFEKSGKHHKKCLEESLQLQKHLQHLTHRVLAAQEDERKKISRELQNEIASTQRLVVKSAKSVRRVTRKFGSL